MFKNSGKKIKTWAIISFVISLISCIIIGFILIMAGLKSYSQGYQMLVGIGVIIFGFISSWISALILHGYGDIIENTEETRYNTSRAIERADENRKLLNELIAVSRRNASNQPYTKADNKLPIVSPKE